MGAGSAGCVLAARLSEDPAAKVLLLEAGPDYPDIRDLPLDLKLGQAEGDVIPGGHLWDLDARFARGRKPARLARGKVVGGSSAVNGQVFLRGIPEDFDSWAAMGATGLDFETLLPYFRRIESDLDFHDEWHGNSGPIPVRRYPPDEWLPPQAAFFEACVAAGFPTDEDANHPRHTGVAPIPFNNLAGVRQSVALTHLAPARERLNLTIAANTRVLRFRFTGRRVVAADVRDGYGERSIRAENFILAAGVIGSPQLLLLSGVGPGDDLTRLGIGVVSDLPGVGLNLRDHQVVDLTWVGSGEAWRPPPRAPLLQVALSYSSRSTVRNDMKLTVRSRSMDTGVGGAGDATLTMVPGVYSPAGAGKLSLITADPDEAPQIDFEFLSDGADATRLRDAVRLGLEISRHKAFAPWTTRRIGPSEADVSSDGSLDRWLRSAVRSSQHACGTCRIGSDGDPLAVVDPAGRVRGVDNLRVVDASIFPTSVRAHINATTIALAERMADLVRNPR